MINLHDYTFCSSARNIVTGEGIESSENIRRAAAPMAGC